MSNLKGNQLKAAELIIEYATIGGTVSMAYILGKNIGWGLEIRDIEAAAEFLEKIGFITFETSKDGNEYRLTKKGERFKEEDKSVRSLVESETKKEAEQQLKEEQDEHYKKLQVRDLEEKLNVMNVEQRDFWKTQKAKNQQTTLIAIISALFSLFALLKTWGVFG